MKGGIGNMMKQAQEMQQRMAKIQEELAAKTVNAESGGGMVKVIATGKQKIVSIKIDKSVVDPEDIEALEDLIVGRGNKRRCRGSQRRQQAAPSLQHAGHQSSSARTTPSRDGRFGPAAWLTPPSRS